MIRLPRVQAALLELLAERGRTHAYEMKRLLKGRIGHPSVYAALSAIQAKGYATAEWEVPEVGERSAGGGPPRKYFEITAVGHAVLAEEAARQRADAEHPRITPTVRGAGG